MRINNTISLYLSIRQEGGRGREGDKEGKGREGGKGRKGGKGG